MAPRVGLVVPSLAQGGGGVAAVARFVKNVVLRSNAIRADTYLAGYGTSGRLLWPDDAPHELGERCRNAAGRVTESAICSPGGAMLAELGVQRYRLRKALTEAVLSCDILQVVVVLRRGPIRCAVWAGQYPCSALPGRWWSDAVAMPDLRHGWVGGERP
jgi:hypothetical protein